MSDLLFYARAYLLYAEHVILPLGVCLLCFGKIKQQFFRVCVILSVFYFLFLCVQGRSFFRYMQIGMIAVMMAFAYPLSYFMEQRTRSRGIVCLAAYLAWGLVAHSSYVWAQSHHIPYADLRERVYRLSGEGRIFAFVRNSETDYYLAPTHVRWFDESDDHCRPGVRLPAPSAPADKFQNLPGQIEALLDPALVRSGDVVVVSGVHMAGGEPNPQSLGIRRCGVRRYGHLLEPVQEFERAYEQNATLQQQYEMVERVFLTHSQTVGALIVKKR